MREALRVIVCAPSQCSQERDSSRETDAREYDDDDARDYAARGPRLASFALLCRFLEDLLALPPISLHTTATTPATLDENETEDAKQAETRPAPAARAVCLDAFRRLALRQLPTHTRQLQASFFERCVCVCVYISREEQRRREGPSRISEAKS